VLADERYRLDAVLVTDAGSVIIHANSMIEPADVFNGWKADIAATTVSRCARGPSGIEISLLHGS
jgi:hypothetical protein